MSHTTNPSVYKIPLVVYQTWKTRDIDSDIINGIITRNKAMNLEFRFVLFDDDEEDAFIEENFDADIRRAYNRINPRFGAARADFWRYCILYKQGGVYMDIKMELKIPLIRIIRPEDECLLDKPRVDYEIYRIENNTPTYEQSILFFSKNHPYLETMIDTMTRNILDGYIPDVRFLQSVSSYSKLLIIHLTGPDAFTAAVNRSIAVHGPRHRNIDYEKISFYSFEGLAQIYERSSTAHYSKVTESIYNEDHVVSAKDAAIKPGSGIGS